MFHQGPDEADPGGVGLGLYIVKRFVEMLGGRVSVTSHLGDGSVFRVSLPAGIAASPASLEEHRAAAECVRCVAWSLVAGRVGRWSLGLLRSPCRRRTTTNQRRFTSDQQPATSD